MNTMSRPNFKLSTLAALLIAANAVYAQENTTPPLIRSR